MSLLTWIILFTVIGGALSVVAASLYLCLPEASRNRSLPHLLSFATGALLGTAFLALLPHAFESEHVTDSHDLFITVLIGILVFFLLEKMVLWRHCHALDCEAHAQQPPEIKQGSGFFVLIGDGIHNFIDGAIIGAAFLTDIHLGIVTSIAVASHEIPQEVADFAILLHSGFSRFKALMFNLLSSLATVVGGVLAYYGFSGLEPMLPFLLAIAAASFIYVAVADLIPGLHGRANMEDTLSQSVLIGIGVLVIFLMHSILH